jgi:predicted NBD/HSP70 family sugar kinase
MASRTVTALGIAIGDRLSAKIAEVTLADATTGGGYDILSIKDIIPVDELSEPLDDTFGNRLQQSQDFILKIPEIISRNTPNFNLKDIVSICYSCIGVFTDETHKSIHAIARKGWAHDPNTGPALSLWDLNETIKSNFSENLKYAAVNDATLCATAEYYYGHGKNNPSYAAAITNDYLVAYVRVSHGVNAGFIFPPNYKIKNPDISLFIRKRNPEFAHNIVMPHKEDAKLLRIKEDPETKWRGTCRHHPYCIEGTSSVTSLIERWKIEKGNPYLNIEDLTTILEAEAALDIPAYYIARMIAGMILAIYPPKIIVGGLLIDKAPNIMRPIRDWTRKILNGYPPYPGNQTEEDYIIQASNDDQLKNSSLTGAVITAALNVAIANPRKLHSLESRRRARH